jgi:nucleolar pre-ribosomal-associated protein 1
MYLLIGSLLETSRNYSKKDPLPSVVTALAARITLVLNNPLHLMYSKANKFLLRSPSWDIPHLPSYWIDRILLHPSDIDKSFYTEVEWLLDMFMDGLQTLKVSKLSDSHPGLNVYI